MSARLRPLFNLEIHSFVVVVSVPVEEELHILHILHIDVVPVEKKQGWPLRQRHRVHLSR